MCVSVFDLKAAIRNCIFTIIPCGDVASELPSGVFALEPRSECPGGCQRCARLHGDVFAVRCTRVLYGYVRC